MSTGTIERMYKKTGTCGQCGSPCMERARICRACFQHVPDPNIPESKLCPYCGKEKSSDEFGVRTDGRWLKSYCRGCDAKKSRAWHNTHKDRVHELERHSSWMRKYGINQAQYDALLAEQGGCCRICKSTDPAPGYKLRKHFSVDHDHATGTIRGLLCSACNRALGLFKDDLQLLINAVTYMQSEPPTIQDLPNEALRLNSPRGEAHGMAKLSDKTVLDIISQFANYSGSIRSFAQELTLPYNTVYNIVKGKRWTQGQIQLPL